MFDKFKIFNRIITEESPTLIIAEIGINHLGDEKLCSDMIIAAVEAGADCVKLQTGNADESFHPDNISYSTFKGNELSRESLIRLSELSKKKGSYLFSSPGDFSSLKLLSSISSEAYKISSGQFTNIPLIEEIIKENMPIIFSTGMADEKDIKRIVDLCKKHKFSNYALLHCISLYPASFDQLNLNYIKLLRNKYNIISGYSDHTLGELACIAAVSLGAKIVEKHFTIDNKLQGADNALSMNPRDFKNMSTKIRLIENMKYKSLLKPHPLELEVRNTRYRKIVAKKDIFKGEQFTIDNVNFMRIEDSSNALFASEWNLVSGKTSNKNIKKNSLITKNEY